jgi:glycerophosphoryl diester phosphodiesterase
MFRLHGYYPLFLNKMGNHPQEERINYYDMIYCVGIFNVNRDNLTDDWVWSSDPIRPKEDFDRLHNKGIQCWVHFSEDSLYRFQRGYEVGVDAFTCNDPEMAAKMLDYIGARKYNTGKKANKI